MTGQWRDTAGKGNNTSNPNGAGEVVINKQQVEALELVLNKVNSRVDYILNAARAMSKEMTSRLTDRRRDYEKECGHPQTGELDAEYYQQLFFRDPIASRVIEVWPKETWRRTPEVYEDENEENETPFEESFDALCAQISGNPYCGDSNYSALWSILESLDIQCGIGRYGVLYIAIADGVDPRFPVAGWKQLDSDMSYGDTGDENYSAYPRFNTQYGFQYGELGNDSAKPTSNPSNYSSNPNFGDTRASKLMYLQVYSEATAKVVKWETNQGHPRYGKPVQYELTTGIADNNANDPPTKGLVVHWSRVVHVADNTNSTSNKVLGTPRCQQVVNRILDLKKLYGGSAEMYWLGALPAIIFKSDPSLGGDVDLNLSVIKDQIERLMNGLQRHAVLNGLDAEGLSPTVVDPRPQIEVQLEAICIKIKVPLRIFKGSERGELSSAQDSVQHSKEIRGRDDRFATPNLICAVVTRFIELDLLVPPGESGYKVYWPDPDNESPQEKATVAATVIKAIAEYITGAVDQYVPPSYLFTYFLGGLLTREEAEVMLEQAKKEYEEKKQHEQEMAMEQQQKSMELAAQNSPTSSSANGDVSSNPNAPANGNTKLVTGDPGSKVGQSFSTNSELPTSYIEEIKTICNRVTDKIDSFLFVLNNSKDNQTQQPINVSVAQPSITVNNPITVPQPTTPGVTVNNKIEVPEQQTPIVNVETTAPVINVQVPEQSTSVVNQINIEPAPITDVRIIQDVPLEVKTEQVPSTNPVEKVVKVEKDSEGKWTGTVQEKPKNK